MCGIIYKITNLINKKVYIGQTIQPIERRWSAHVFSKIGCPKIGRAIKKHGSKNFSIEKIDSDEQGEGLDKKEEYWISFFDSIRAGYNLKSGGHSSRYSEESRLKMSISQKKRFETEPNPRLGVKASLETRKRISESKKGSAGFTGHHTEESKRKMSESQKKRFKTERSYWFGKKMPRELVEKAASKKRGIKKSEEEKQKRRETSPLKRAVEGTSTLDGSVLFFLSVKDASRNGNVFNPPSISECCSGKRKSHRGYTWRYKEN